MNRLVLGLCSVTSLPVIDGAGNALVGFRSRAETWQPRLDARIPMPFALIVVTDLDLDLAAVVECLLRRPRRREYGAIFRCSLAGEPQLVVNDDVADFRWWDPRSPRWDDMSPIDAEIARRVFD